MAMTTSAERSIAHPDARFLFAHPAHLLALGFGSGLPRKAPGTFGTLFGWALHAALVFAVPALEGWSWWWVAILVPAFLIGIPACTITGRHLGVSDHGSMVWDEIVAIVLVLATVPSSFGWQLAGFVVFRLFDITKPPPISTIERRYHAGFGVMIDDLAAAVISIALLLGAQSALQWVLA
ncbi:phosphatidylglycerophosphatase A [soil metagenome]